MLMQEGRVCIVIILQEKPFCAQISFVLYSFLYNDSYIAQNHKICSERFTNEKNLKLNLKLKTNLNLK